jgi:hypothetical protein
MKKMTSKRFYYVMIGILSLMVVGFIGGAYGVNVFLQKQSLSVVDARSRSASLEQQQTQLSVAKASITKYQEVGQIAKSIVPQDKDQAQAIREIVNIANANGINLGTITFPSSTLGAIGAGAASAGNLSQLKPAAGIGGVYTLELTVQSDSSKQVTYNQFIQFLAALEHNRRTALVSGLVLQPDSKNASLVTFTLTIDEYIKP